MRFPIVSLSILHFNPKLYLALAFLLPFSVRALPEILMREYIVGFDTISYYVPVAWKWVNFGVNFWKFFGYAPLFYLLLSGLTLVGIPLTVSLKVLPPFLHGFLGLAIFGYAVKSLDWSYVRGLFVSSLATLYFVGLRISWDMLRSELGLIFFFAFLIALKSYLSDSIWKMFTLLLSSAVLVALSHQLVSIVMFAVVLAVALEKMLNRHVFMVLRLFSAVLPAMLLFGLTVYADYVILPVFSEDAATSGRLMWLTLLSYSSAFDGIANTIGFILFCYLPLLPFIVLGMQNLNCLELKAWSIWCLAGVAIPFFFSNAPLVYRWILLLVFPFSFFAVEGFKKVKFGLSKKVLVGFATVLSFSFVFLPAEAAFPYFRLYPYYVPSSMLQNSVPLSDCSDVVAALNWARDNVGSSGALMVHDAFYGWVTLYDDGIKILRYGYAPPRESALKFFGEGYSPLLLVWWVNGEGWHGQVSLPSSFNEVFHSGRIAVYKFEAQV